MLLPRMLRKLRLVLLARYSGYKSAKDMYYMMGS